MFKLVDKLRAEDVLAASFALFLVLLAGIPAVVHGLRLSEDEYWELSFIVAPLAVLTFAASFGYAVRGGRALFAKTLHTVATLVRDWCPFLCFLLAYEGFRLRIWTMINPADRDAMLMHVDRMLFGQTPAILLQSIVSPLLTDILTAAYSSHLVLPPLLATMFYLSDRRTFRQFLLAILLAGSIGFLGYLCVPAVGPGIAFQGDFTRQLTGHLAGPILGFFDATRAPRDVFPSLHAGVAAIVLWFSLRLGRRWFWVLAPIVAANWFSTVYLRYHYLIDVFAGWLVAALAVYLSGLLLNLEQSLRSRNAGRVAA